MHVLELSATVQMPQGGRVEVDCKDSSVKRYTHTEIIQSADYAPH